MKRLACALAVVSVTMMGCGSSLCDDFADTTTGLNDKIKDCPSFSGVTFDKPTDAEIKQCKDNLDKCTDSDKKILEKFNDCASALPKCTASTEQSFSSSFLACAAPLQNVSDACGSTTGASMGAKAAALLSSHR